MGIVNAKKICGLSSIFMQKKKMNNNTDNHNRTSCLSVNKNTREMQLADLIFLKSSQFRILCILCILSDGIHY